MALILEYLESDWGSEPFITVTLFYAQTFHMKKLPLFHSKGYFVIVFMINKVLQVYFCYLLPAILIMVLFLPSDRSGQTEMLCRF